MEQVSPQLPRNYSKDYVPTSASYRTPTPSLLDQQIRDEIDCSKLNESNDLPSACTGNDLTEHAIY